MALQAPIGIPRYSAQGCRCSFVQPSLFCAHPEKFQLVFKGQLTYHSQKLGKSMHIAGVVLSQASFTALEEVGTSKNIGGNEILMESDPIQVQKSEEPLSIIDGIFSPQDTSSSLEALNEHLRVTTDDASVGETSILDSDPSQLDITIPDISLPGSTASESSEEAARTATESLSTEQFKSAKEAYEAIISGSRNSTEQGSSIDALSRTSQSIADEFSEIKSAILNRFVEVQESVLSSVDNVKMTLKNTYDNINGSITSSLQSSIFPIEKPKTALVPKVDKVADMQERFIESLMSPFQMGTPANNALKQIVTTFENVTSRSFVGASELVANGYLFTKEFLPANVQMYLSGLEKKISEISGPIWSALQQGYTVILDTERAVGINPDNPIIPIILVVGGGFSLGLLYQQLRYGGYSGDLAPASALDLLKKEGNILLIDIRSEELRESEGIPDLRRQVRFKAASVAQFKIQNSLQKMLKSTADAEAAITASAIKNLKNVKGNTKIILLDADGSQSKRIARALKKTGIQMPYRIEGGFKAWEANGLRVKQGLETPLTIIKEETEAILDEVKPTPVGIAAATLGVFAGLYALIEWEKTFQLLGLVCIGQLLYTRLNSYESADDAKNDLKLLLRPFTLATQGIIWAAGAVEPSKLQLATSPSTSAVQDRVLQAAAKHGPLPSEANQEQQEAFVVEDDTESNISDGEPAVQD